MAERAPTDNVIPTTSPSTPSTVKSPDSDVSPKTPAPTKSDDYFGTDAAGKKQLQVATAGQDALPKTDAPPSSSTSTAPSTATSGSATAPDGSTDSRRPSYNDYRMLSRKSSSASVSFRSPRNPSLPQGLPRKTDNRRLRESSPSPVKFRQHIAFDNVQYGEATKNNALSFTLHARHQGYQPSRRSRTFMVGVDEHAYSDYALVWLLNNMVDDGDEVVCVRVLEAPPKNGTTNYQDDAKKLMQTIQEKNEQNKAISIVLEYAVGKLHATFQQLLHVHQPSMLVVGTKGRSLGGFQGLMNTRNSFSKYCLQYSPVPVVVVRPDDKRQKKKDKRTHDPSRQSYANMLAHNAGKHEADSEASSLYELEKGISPDEEAHRVAAAIGLPAAFDPTIKPYLPNHPTRSSSNVHSPATTDTRSASPHPTNYTNDSGDEDSGDDDDEFEVEAVSAQQLVRGKEKQTELEREQKERLHRMEVGEAAALLKSKQSESNDDDDDDDESQDKASKK